MVVFIWMLIVLRVFFAAPGEDCIPDRRPAEGGAEEEEAGGESGRSDGGGR